MIPMALRIGAAHIDASCVVYFNEKQVGEALAAVPRDMFPRAFAAAAASRESKGG